MTDPRLAEWLASRDTGTSSKAIMLWLSSSTVDAVWGPSTPSDPSDLGRCLRLLDLIPEWKPRMSEMAAAGGLWPTFSRRWDEIVATYLEEAGGAVLARDATGSFPKTYDLMKAVHAEAYATDRPDFTEISFGSGATMRFKMGGVA